MHSVSSSLKSVIGLATLRVFKARCERLSSVQLVRPTAGTTQLGGVSYPVDSQTNVTPRILSRVGRNLHNAPGNALYLIKERIKRHFYRSFLKTSGNPLFSVFDNIGPVVTLEQNFDSLLVPRDHPSRVPSDSYYLNETHMLRGHTSAHQRDLIRMGSDAFLVFGDVYRRDSIDRTHYPAFHQADGVRCFTSQELFSHTRDNTGLVLFEKNPTARCWHKQACHTMDAAKLLQHDLQTTLTSLTAGLFGPSAESRWVDAFFPFTHPSWELEIKYGGQWMEVLGCGLIEQDILTTAGAGHKVGWAFGLGLERLAMRLYSVPDIRLFWSRDTGVQSQFEVADPDTPITYKPVSVYPQCTNDISFWVPDGYTENDFCDLVRSVGGDYVEQVILFDKFFHPKKQCLNHSYHIVYRAIDRTLTQEEVNVIHRRIEQISELELGVKIRVK